MAQYKTGQKKKDDILNLCRKLFYENGYDETSMRDIASQLNIDAGTILYHFNSKDNIYRILKDDINRNIHNEVRHYISQDDSREYLAFMLHTVIFTYKFWADEKFRRFVGANLIDKQMNFVEYYRYYFGLYKLIDNYPRFVEKHEFELRNCYYVDMGITQDLCNSFEYYRKRYDYLEMAKCGFNVYTKFFDMPADKVAFAYEELDEIIAKVDFDSLHYGL